MRINEDYLEVVDRNDYIDDLSMNVNKNAEYLLLNGKSLNIDFNLVYEPVYTVQSFEELYRLINSAMIAYGDDCNLNWIDVSQIENMSYLFYNTRFTGDISRWDVSNVTNMTYMFQKSQFDGNISGWDVSRVESMGCMF